MQTRIHQPARPGIIAIRWRDRLTGAVRRADRALRLALLCALGLLLPLVSSQAEDGAAAGQAACRAESLLPALAEAGKLPAMETAASLVPNGEGKLFRIEREGLAPSFLFGTMHMTDPRILALEPAAAAAFDGAGRLVVETVDMLDETKAYGAMLMRPDLMNLPAGKRLGDFLTPDQLAMLTEKLAADGIPLQSIETLQPWFFTMGAMIPACEAARTLAGEKPLDLKLAADAEAAGKPVLGLETAVEQLEAMASLPMDIQVASLLSTLELKPKLPGIFETMTELYLDGRIAMIVPLTEAVMPEGALSAEMIKGYAAFEARIVTRRNHTMAERLRPILAEGGTFVAVGALHLPGREGLVELLRAEGYTVTRAD